MSTKTRPETKTSTKTSGIRRLRPPVIRSDVLTSVVRNSERYLSNLNATDLQSLKNYVAMPGISNYIPELELYASYENLNNYLYNPQRKDLREEQRAFFHTWAEKLTSILHHAPKAPEDVIVYRGLTPSVIQAVLEKLKPGDLFHSA